jgi:dTDP-4-dehydrorhamnose 3,5-epimerase
MLLDIKKTKIEDCYELQPKIFNDKRGIFVKTFHKNFFRKNNLVTEFSEEYYSYSECGVLRGLHFQIPPMDHTKIVYCLSGEVQDVVVDLREGSPTFGEYEIFDLNSTKRNMIYIPSGLAHGFYVTGSHALVMYKVTSVYSPQHDGGILWNSLNIPWLAKNPIISERDTNFPAFSEFKSPFIYK